MKNKRFIFFTVTLLVLIIGLGVISAESVDNSTASTDSQVTSQVTHEDQKVVATSNEPVKKVETTGESVKTNDNKEKIKSVKQEETVGSTSVEREQVVSNYDSLKTVWNNTFTYGDNDTSYVVKLKNGNYSFTDELSVKDTNVTSITFIGEDRNLTVLDGNHNSRFFVFDNSNMNITIENMTLQNGYHTGKTGVDSSYGGAVYSISNLTLVNTYFTNNTANLTSGGAVRVSNAMLTVYNSTFYKNNVTRSGGGFQGVSGGAISVYEGGCNISESIFQENIAKGGMYAQAGAIQIVDLRTQRTHYNVTIRNSFFKDNDAVSSWQGGLKGYSILFTNNDSNATLENCVFSRYDSREVEGFDRRPHSYVTINNNYFNENLIGDTVNNSVLLAFSGNIVNTALSQYDDISVSYITQGLFEDSPVTCNLGIAPYRYQVTSDSDLLNLSDVYLEPANNYSVKLNTTSLRGKIFDDINIYVNGVKAGSIYCVNTRIIQDDIRAKPGDIINISPLFTDSRGNGLTSGRVVYKLNGKTIGSGVVSLGKSVFRYKIPENYTPKNYTIQVVYGGTSNFPSARVNSTLILNKNNANMTLGSITANPGETVQLKASIINEHGTSINSGKVVFKLNGKSLKDVNKKVIIVRVHNGTAVYNYTIPGTFSAKNYTLSAISVGNTYNKVETSSNIILNKIDSYIKVNNVTINGNSLKVNATINNRQTGNVASERLNKVSVKLDGKTVIKEVKVVNGIINLNTTVNTGNGNHTVEIVTSGNSIYNSVRQNVTVQKTSSLKQAVKKETIVDYYVSDSNGSDNNSGTLTQPFKTIQHAINMVTTTNIYNIHILNGTYKGVGNTNLTVNGNYNINFIGEGINNTIIDGEVNYTIGGASVWGGAGVWNPYVNGSGNWIMNITNGTGHILLTNFTIQKAWVYAIDGGDSISKYPTAPVDNYGNLEVENMYFYYNHAGVGSGIRNNANATLYINNTVFEKNRKSESTGNDGIIYNRGIATINNTLFTDNYARWGTVTNDGKLIVVNTNFTDNHAYNGGSTFKYGSGIAANTGGADFFNPYGVNNITTIVNNCTFTRNEQTDIYVLAGITNITDNYFNNSTGIYAGLGTSTQTNTNYINIINNTFNNIMGSSLYQSLSSTTLYSRAITVTSPDNSTRIESNKITVNSRNDGDYAISLTGNKNHIVNNTMDRELILSGSYNTIDNNNITTTTDTYSINITTGRRNNITNNYIRAKSYMGVDSVNDISNNYVLDNNNTPKSNAFTLTDNTYSRYFNNNGYYRTSYGDNMIITITEALHNKNLIFENVTNITILQQKQPSQLQSINTTIQTNDTTLTITGLGITNTDKPALILGSDNNTVKQSQFNTQADYTIELTGINNTVTNNVLVANILVGNESVKTDTSKNNTIKNNNPTYKNYVITQENYNTYFDENSTFTNPDNITEAHILLSGDFYNKTFRFNTTTVISSYKQATIHNGTIILYGNPTMQLSNITVINSDDKNALIIDNPYGEKTVSYNNFTTKATSIITLKEGNYTGRKMIGTVIRINYNNITTISNNASCSLYFYNTSNQIFVTYNTITTTGSTNTISILSELTDMYSIHVNNNNIKTTGNGNDTIIYSIKGNNDINVQNNNIETIGTVNATSIYGCNGFSNINAIAKNTAIGIHIPDIQKISLGSDRIDSKINTNANNTIGILLENSNSSTITKFTITTQSNKTIGILIQNCTNTTISNNTIKINDKNTDGIPLLLTNNSTRNIIQNNSIFTATDNTIQLNDTSDNNSITYNTLIANELMGDKSIQSSGQNRIRDNTPQRLNTNYLLRDSTYSQYFDENGQLRKEITPGSTIEMIDEITNKNIIINKPINFIQTFGTIINGTIKVTGNSTGTNITKLNINNTNISKSIVVNADNITVTITNLRVTNNNITTNPVQINGNNNNITLTYFYIISDTDVIFAKITGNNNQYTTLDNNIQSRSGITLGSGKYFNMITLEGNNNTITTNYVRVHVPDVIINNIYYSNYDDNYTVEAYKIRGNYNNININSTESYNSKNLTYMKLEDSNYNKINLNKKGITIYTNNYFNITTHIIKGIILINSSNNIISNATLDNRNYPTNDQYALQLTKGSDNNLITDITIQNLKVLIDNSSYNNIAYNKITTEDTYTITITNTAYNNTIRHNQLQSQNLQGDSSVGADNLNNTIEYNTPRDITQTSTIIKLENSQKNVNIDDTIIITANITEKNGNLIPDGKVTFKIDNTIIGVVDVINGTACINYTIPDINNTTQIITATYEDNDYYATNTTSEIINIIKIKTNIIVGNITNNGRNAILTAVVTTDNMNYVTTGSVTFKVDNKTVGTSNINNGVAVLGIDVSKYSAGNHTITATYNKNNKYMVATGNATLTINKYNATMTIEEVNTKPGEIVTFRVYLTDNNGNPINNGKVIFKLNGKTLKDEKGNTITVRVHNGIAQFNYTIPASYSAKNYTLTAVTVGNTYNRIEASTNITLTKINTYIQPVNIQFNGNTLHVQANIISTSTQENTAYRETRVTVKINNKTFAKEVKVKNGTLDLNIDTSGIGRGNYKITIKAGENGICKGSQLDSYTYKAPVKQTSNNSTLVKA